MEPKTIERHPAVDGLTAEELYGEESLNEIEVEDLLGHDVDFDEKDDWRAIDF
jgi:hypothetical protein